MPKLFQQSTQTNFNFLIYDAKRESALTNSLLYLHQEKMYYLFYFLDNCFERFCMVQCQIRQYFAVQLNVCLRQFVDEH